MAVTRYLLASLAAALLLLAVLVYGSAGIDRVESSVTALRPSHVHRLIRPNPEVELPHADRSAFRLQLSEDHARHLATAEREKAHSFVRREAQ